MPKYQKIPENTENYSLVSLFAISTDLFFAASSIIFLFLAGPYFWRLLGLVGLPGRRGGYVPKQGQKRPNFDPYGRNLVLKMCKIREF